MRKILIIIFLMLLICPLVSIISEINVKGSENKNINIIKIGINEGKWYPHSFVEHIENAISDYEWVVDDYTYKFDTDRIDIDVVEVWEELTKYDVHIIDGPTDEYFRCSSANWNYNQRIKLKKNLDNFIWQGGGFIGRCAAGLTAADYTNNEPNNLFEYYLIKSNAYLSRRPDIQVHVKNGFLMYDQFLQMIYPFNIPIPVPRIPSDPTSIGAVAYMDYNSMEGKNKEYAIDGVSTDLINLDTVHPILDDYHGETLYSNYQAGGVFPYPPEDVSVLAYISDEVFENNDKQDVSVWKFELIKGILNSLKKILSWAKEGIGIIPVDDLPSEWQDLFVGREEVYLNEILEKIITDWKCWKKLIPEEKAETQSIDNPAIIAFDYNEGRAVLSGPHPAGKIIPHNLNAEIFDNDDNGQYNSISEGLYYWKNSEGDKICKEDLSLNTDLYWYQRREAAWAAQVPDNHLPPVYGRSQVIDFDTPLQTSAVFDVTCCVGRDKEANWSWADVELSLYYNFSTDGKTGWSGWIYYDKITDIPYKFTFNAANANGSGHYQFCSILETKGTSDEFPPEYDAIVAVDTSIASYFDIETSYLYANSSIIFNSSKSATTWGTNITSYDWQFSDGKNSTEQNPTHIFADDGIYNVTLTIQNDGAASDNFTRTITVHNNPPIADFEQDCNIIFVNEQVNFTDNSSEKDGNLSQWIWDFGDNINSTVQNTNHSYSNSGYYDIILRVTDDDNDTTTNTSCVLVIDSLVNQSKTQSGNIWNNIQDAVDNSSDYNILYIENGTYSENITFNRSISIIGENRDNVVITGSVDMINPRDYELPDKQSLDLFTTVNMTCNALLMHFNNDSDVGENYSTTNFVYDYSGLENNGTNYGATWVTSALKGAGAFDFNGNDSSINLGSISGFIGENVTVSTWIFWKGGSGSIDPIISQSNDTKGYCLYINSSNSKPVFRLDSSEVISSVSISSNEWHHIVGTHNETSLKIYVDGILQGSSSKSGSGLEMDCYIGFDNLSNYFNGSIDEIAIWNYTLSDDEIKMIYDSNYGICIEGVTIKDQNIGITVCNHSKIFNCILDNNTIGILMNDSCDIRINMCNITNATTGISIVDSNPDSFYFNHIFNCFIDDAISAIVVNNSTNLILARDIVNGSSSNLSFTNCDFNNISVMYCDSPNNVAPDTPYLNGPTFGDINVSYNFSAVTNDTNDDQIEYWFDWGDGNNTGWQSLFVSNETINASHVWTEQGGYYIRVKVKDIFDNETSWSEPILFKTENLPPLINSVNNSPDLAGFGTDITILVNVTDDSSGNQSGIQYVKVNISYPDDSYVNNSMTDIGNDTYQYVFSDTWTVGLYNYSIWAVDDAYNVNSSIGHSFNISANATIKVSTIKDSYGDNETVNLTDPPPGSSSIGYEFLDNGSVLYIWNQYNSYYFNTSNGIQFTNHYDKYWTHNVLMLGYYNNNIWNLIYRTDELSGFNQNISSDNTSYVNATLWKNLTYSGYDFRLAIRYHLGVDDSDLTVIPYIKNIDDENIPYNLGFGWEMKDIRIANVTSDNYLQVFNGTGFERILLNQTLDRSFTDMDYNTTIKLICTNPPSDHISRNLYLSWGDNLNYKVTVKNRTGQYNAPVSLFIKIGTLNIGQEKYTQMHWLDSDNWLGIDGSNRDSECGYDHVSVSFETALNGTSMWLHGMRETHWGIIDLGYTYNISKIRGRSNSLDDPVDVDVYISNSKTSWGSAVVSGISSWQDTSSWVEINSTDKNGRYIKIEIIDTEGLGGPQFLNFGNDMSPFQIFDVYGSIINRAPDASSPVPIPGSDGASITPLLNITVSDPDGDSMSISWLSNSSGSWQVFGTNNSVSNGTYHQTMSNVSVNGQWWYWKVNVSDGVNYTITNAYSFYTGYESKIKNTGSTNIKGYLLMQVQFYNNSTWVVADDTINETTLRTINASTQLGLDTLFNGLVNTSNLSSYGNGTYRIYVAFRDPDGNILVCDDETELVATYEFTITYD